MGAQRWWTNIDSRLNMFGVILQWREKFQKLWHPGYSDAYQTLTSDCYCSSMWLIAETTSLTNIPLRRSLKSILCQVEANIYIQLYTHKHIILKLWVIKTYSGKKNQFLYLWTTNLQWISVLCANSNQNKFDMSLHKADGTFGIGRGY